MMGNLFQNYFEQTILEKLLENRETCHHWINYKIYDAGEFNLSVGKKKFFKISLHSNPKRIK